MIGLILTESALFTIFVVAYLFYIGKSAHRSLSQGRARSADSRHDLFAIQQRDSRAGGARLSTGTYWGIPTLVADHDSPRGGVLGLHRFGMAEIDL